MSFAALVLAQVFRLTVPCFAQQNPSVSDASGYHFTEFADSLDRVDAFRYQLAEFADSLDRVDAFRYQLAEFSDAVDRDFERCICTTTRLSPVTLRVEVLLVSDCDCGH